MQLKHIFSNINIANLLLKIKKYFNDKHFANIYETILKFQACSLEKCFAIYQCPIYKATHKFILISFYFISNFYKKSIYNFLRYKNHLVELGKNLEPKDDLLV